jgi:hypothetical protein
MDLTSKGHITGSLWEPGQLLAFEYHCWRSHESGDAELWYRDHQMVTIIAVDLTCDGYKAFQAGVTSANERIEEGIPVAYVARFADGHEHTVLEDELFIDTGFFDASLGPPSADAIVLARASRAS